MRLFLFILLAAIYIGSAAWAMRDAMRRGTHGAVIGALFWIFGPLAVLPWIVFRPPLAPVIRTYADYPSPEVAMEGAAALDSEGEWYAAIDLYHYVARRWPEHTNYAFRCIDEIQHKQLMAER